jgi:aryl-alcohol dehydrogenase-like predicted oxidoreductase
MRYRLLGNTGLRVAEICLGTMTFGEDWGWGASRDESRAIFDAYVKLGGNFIDTANHHTNGTSERLVGEFVAADRARFVVATKYTLGQAAGDPNAAGSHRKSLVQSLEGSLKRLGTDYVDVYWVHAWDELTPLDECIRALDDQVCAGKVLYLGISDAPAWVVARANTMAEERGWTPFSAIQVQYSLVERTVERELAPMARALDLALFAWAPLAGGVLSGKYLPEARDPGLKGRFVDSPMAGMFVNERTHAITREVMAVARELGRGPAQVAIGWLLRRPGLVIPIVGARRAQQLADGLAALALDLPRAALERLDKASRTELGFPHDFLAAPPVREMVYAGAWNAILNHRH